MKRSKFKITKKMIMLDDCKRCGVDCYEEG
jgi:hypothetical protein